MKKIVLFLSLLILIQNCGFTPVYVSNKNVNFEIKEINFKGNQELNNFINIGLKRYITKNNQKNSFKISAITDYNKEIQSKDTKGNAQSFKVKGSVTFIVTGNNKKFNFIYSEQADINNIEDTFELNSYESSIKQNFASSMVDKFILDLSNKQ